MSGSGFRTKMFPRRRSMDFQGEQAWDARTAKSEAADRPGRTRIGMAAERGDFRKVEAYIEDGDDPNAPDDYDETPLYIASGVGALVIVKYLVEEHAADVSHRNHDKWTPLAWAVARGHLKVAKYLVARGANPNSMTSLGWRPLHLAAMLARVDIVRFLLDQGAHVGVANVHGCTPIYAAATEEIRQILIDVEDEEFAAGEAARRHIAPHERVNPYPFLNTTRHLNRKTDDLQQFDPGFWRPQMPPEETSGPQTLATRMGEFTHAKDQRVRPPQNSFKHNDKYVQFN
eukprot:CAMPEP_0197853200 /NCGR_PEP_ID=MMETSP1438-20131217/22268_1 /TAXON_ID=1461541 /ORGANISM="Pterosperma sp., Strain CCMP1384" /LENGTH=286 /DNA_ID=CAMNT_0043467511 /DNA_START=255 /DNA_END=1112 /DNA_ORIENTATION=+